MINKNELTIRFFKSIDLENEINNFNIEVENCVRSSFDNNIYTLTLRKNSPWVYRDLDLFEQKINSVSNVKYDIIYIYSFNYIKEYKQELLELINDFLFNHVYKKFNFTYKFEEISSRLVFVFNNENEFNEFKNIEEELKSFIKHLSINLNIETMMYKEKNDKEDENYSLEETKKIIDKETKEVNEKYESELQEQLRLNYQLMLKEREQQRIYKSGEYPYFLIGTVKEDSGYVDVSGKVFSLKDFKTKNGKTFYTIGLSDNSGAIDIVTSDTKTGFSKENYESLHIGSNLRVKGKSEFDSYRKEVVIRMKDFSLLPDTPLRKDNEENKRVELHLHTKLSDFDGVSDILEYVNLAKSMGHKALAITDHANVHVFPIAQPILKKNGIKGLYGAELNVYSGVFKCVYNPNDTILKEGTYICLDTETTGLSSKFDRITEFGAVKIEKGVVVSRIDLLINPERDIPLAIQEKTNITNEMVKDKPTFKEASKQILDFIGNDIIVAHNAKFDIDMLNESLKRNGLNILTNPVVDTEDVSKVMFPEAFKHSLGALCKRFMVDYKDDEKDDEDDNEDKVIIGISNEEKHQAHRADYDAEVLSECWLSMISSFVKENPNITLKDLENKKIPLVSLRKYKGDYHVTVLAKNDKGIKDLYKIISDSHINHIGSKPYTLESYLYSHRDNLLIGSSCFNGEVFQSALLKDDETLRKVINKFDYIEIQPLSNYQYLIDKGEIENVDMLKDILKNIIKISKQENKIVVATGDVHYANSEERIYRDIIISAQQIGGGLHPLLNYKLLKKFKNQNKIYETPLQHYRSTNEMLEEFSYLDNDLAREIVITNSNLIADMIDDDITPVKVDPHPPHIENCDTKLKELVYKNAHELFGDKLPEVIEERIKVELDGIIKSGYAVVYYVSYMLVDKAHKDGFIVGSRGSVGSSLVATLSDITEVNPLPPFYRCPNCKHFEWYNEDPSMCGFDLESKKCPNCGHEMIHDGQSIPFQTFLGFNAEKVPDIDLNFDTDYKDRANDYCKELLGKKNVFRAGTIGAVQEKTAFGYVKKYFELFYDYDFNMNPNVVSKARINSLALGVTEIKRTTGQHPAGIVVVPEENDIYDFTPIQYPADDPSESWFTTHFAFTDMHDTLLKFDILGHVDPQALKMMCDLTNINVKDIPLNDKNVLSLFTRDDALNLNHEFLKSDNGSLGIPEFGTEFVRQVLRETKPKTVRDLIIISGLTHGTNVYQGNQQAYIVDGSKTLNDLIGCRDDIMTYLISKGIDSLDAFNIMETVRKKGKYLSSEQIALMKAHGVPDFYISSCDKIEYLFPKGHATAYVMMALRVGYFKVYYPLEYYATFFSLRCDAYDIETMLKDTKAVYEKLEELRNKRKDRSYDFKQKDSDLMDCLEVVLEFKERGYHFENVSLKESLATRFKINYENKSLIPPFKVIPSMGDTNCNDFVKLRDLREFTSKEDFKDNSGLSETVYKFLNNLGVLDGLKETDKISLFDFNF